MEAKKNPEIDLRSQRPLIFHISLCISLIIVLTAFEWKSKTVGKKLFEPEQFANPDALIEIPITDQSFPTPPKVIDPKIVTVPDEIELNTIDIVIEMDPIGPLELAISDDIPIIETADVIHDFAEQLPEPIGGMDAWNSYLKKNLKYPSTARRMGIEGTVYLMFIVNTDGSIQHIEVLRGIGGGCDEEAIRVISQAPKWEPGKQRGRPVRVRMRLPIRFKLG